MGERKGVNKYYPPDWDPSKGSINDFVGQHPLRERARKLGQGILIIRFEMPYNIWCGGCNNHIGMGVRYNAEKSKTGMYYSTPIYKFRMKCHLCDNHFEIQTDPKNHDYVILEGARRKEQRWDPKENEQIVTEDKATQKKMATDAMFKMEHDTDDAKKSKNSVATLSSLELRRDEWKDDYTLNKLARNKFREEKKAIKLQSDSDAALLERSSLDIPLEKEREEDIKLAGLMKYRTVESFDEKQAHKRKELESRPLFEPAGKVSRTELTSPENKKLDIIKRHLKIARNNAQTSPFDRTKMQTLGSAGASFCKESLGIRRKSLTKYKIFEKETKEPDKSEDAEHASSVLDGIECSGKNDDARAAENSADTADEHLIPSSFGKSLVVQDSSGALQVSVDKPEKSPLPESQKIEHKCDENKTHFCDDSTSCNQSQQIEDKKQTHKTSIEIEDQLKADYEEVSQVCTDERRNDSGLTRSSDVLVATEKTTGLGLVCSYSDSDSDT